MWQMLDIRSEAIAKLSRCAAPTTKILLGRRHDHPPWVRDGFLLLCLRHEPLDMQDAKALSVKEILGVAEAREKIRSEVMTSPYPHGVRRSYTPEEHFQSE
jgi:hypothetical protein